MLTDKTNRLNYSIRIILNIARMDPRVLNLLSKNTPKIQRQFYDKLNCVPSPADHPGYVYCIKKTNDPKYNGYVKLGRTERDPEIRASELNSTLCFYQKTSYNKKCERLIHLLFNCYSSIMIGPDGSKQVEWFKLDNKIDTQLILNLVSEQIQDKPDQLPEQVQIPEEIKSVELVQDDLLDDDKYEDDLDVAFGIAIGLIGGIVVGGLVSAFIDNKNISSDIKSGLPANTIEIIKLAIEEKPLYYYSRDKIIIILTDKRFIKLENNQMVSISKLSDIKCIGHKKGGLFHYDKIEIVEKSNRVETFGIYEGKICQDFIQLINQMIEKKN